jgi:hypothetical protein
MRQLNSGKKQNKNVVYVCKLKKTAKENNRPTGENLPNLVAMLVTRLDFFSFRQNGKQILFVNLF